MTSYQGNTTGTGWTPIGGATNTPAYTTTAWSAGDYAERKNLEGWLRILVARIEQLQDKIRELEGKIDGR